VVQGPIRLPRRVGPGGRTTEYPPNDWSPEEVERRIAGEAVEWLFVFDPLGRQVARFRGTPDEVDLSDELKARSHGLYGAPILSDHLVVHNHPVTVGRDAVSSFPPSPLDVFFAIERDLRELVVVSGHQRYAVRRPGDHWLTDEHDLSRIIGEMRPLIERDDDPSDKSQGAVIRRLRLILHRLAEEGWIDYESSFSAWRH
jgi:hypothetical protein